MAELDTIGSRLRYLRKKAGFSQETTANLIYVSRETIRDWELGGSLPSCDSLIALAACFSVSVDFILGVSDAESIRLDHLTEDEAKAVALLIHAMEKANRPSES